MNYSCTAKGCKRVPSEGDDKGEAEVRSRATRRPDKADHSVDVDLRYAVGGEGAVAS